MWVSGEEIYLDCTLRNSSRRDITVSLTGNSWNLTLEDESGAPVRNVHDSHEMPISFFSEVMFPLTASAEKTVSLWLLYYDNTGTMTGSAHDLRPGLYRAVFTFKGERSNEAEFRVVARPPEEELVREQLNKNVVAFKSPGNGIAECRRLLRIYPHSILVGNIYHELMTLLAYKGRYKEAKEVAFTFMRSHPDAGGMRLAAMYYLYGLKDSLGINLRAKVTAEQVQKLATLMKNHLRMLPRFTGAARHMRDEIEQLEREK